MNKWIGIAALVLIVLAIGYIASRPGPDETVDPTPAPAPVEPTEDGGSETPAAGSADASCPTPTNSGSGANRAGLLVTFGDGTSQSVCVSFDEPTISGYQLLEDSGLQIVTKDFGGSLGQALCKVTGSSTSNGCPSDDCFCHSPPNSWVFFVTDQTSWQESSTGISSTNVKDGGAQAQLWGNNTQSPPLCFFKDICLDS
ncbi:MAG: hypothetical protein AAF604_05530 [Acidobacteriota bacterium]